MDCMNSTLPYEKPSVFSAVNIQRPDLLADPLFDKVERESKRKREKERERERKRGRERARKKERKSKKE
jgi:hypothetical protein